MTIEMFKLIGAVKNLKKYRSIGNTKYRVEEFEEQRQPAVDLKANLFRRHFPNLSAH